VYILHEAGWTAKASLNAVDNSKIQRCCLNLDSDFSVVYRYRLRYLSCYNYIQNYKLIRRQVKILTKIHVDQCLKFLITSLYAVRLCSNPAAVFPFASPHGTLHYLVFQVREIGITM